MSKWIRSFALAIAAVFLFDVIPVEAGSAGKAIAKSATKRVIRKAAVARQKLGLIHQFRKPQILVRWTKSPSLDKAKGLPTKKDGVFHIFTQYSKRGRKPSPEVARRSLNIPHRVKYWEKIKVAPGTRYHVRPIKGGKRGEKEVILHGRIPSNSITCGNC